MSKTAQNLFILLFYASIFLAACVGHKTAQKPQLDHIREQDRQQLTDLINIMGNKSR